MVKIIVETKSKEKSEIIVHGDTIEVMEELSHGLNKILKELKMPYADEMTDRIDLLHGAMLADLVLVNGLDSILK